MFGTVSSVFMALTRLTADISPLRQNEGITNFASPAFTLVSMIIYVIIIVKVRINLMHSSRTVSFFKCFSRLIVVSFSTMIADLIFPLSLLVEQL
ncbi:hypothetical protein PMAYCL1PPCAC_05134, partial [Pristionchus mayeri]